MKTTVIYHSADFDGIFCREIASKFLPDAELIGWNFGDPHPPIPEGKIYVMDLPIDRVFGMEFGKHPTIEPLAIALPLSQIIWIDHHKSSIETHPSTIPGYRIDGVAACRLAWQWFAINQHNAQNVTNPALIVPFPSKQEFIDRTVSEPWAVRLAGEYDIFDKRDPRAELFQHGLRSQELGKDEWTLLLSNPLTHDTEYDIVDKLLRQAKTLSYARENEYREVITLQGFTTKFEGVTFLACNSHRLDIRSHLFEAGIKPEHEALLGFTFMGNQWSVSMYHIPGKEHVDILSIAKQHGGGGHKGACGFTAPLNMATLLNPK